MNSKSNILKRIIYVKVKLQDLVTKHKQIKFQGYKFLWFDGMWWYFKLRDLLNCFDRLKYVDKIWKLYCVSNHSPQILKNWFQFKVFLYRKLHEKFFKDLGFWPKFLMYIVSKKNIFQDHQGSRFKKSNQIF